MTQIYSYTCALNANIVDAFCLLQAGFTDQFVYYKKAQPMRFLGLGRCIALKSLDSISTTLSGPANVQPTFFSFKRFDEHNPKPAGELFDAFPNLNFMLPEVVLIENREGTFLQVNSLGPVSASRAERFVQMAKSAPARTCRTIAYEIEPDSPHDWQNAVSAAKEAINSGEITKIVLSRKQKLCATENFSSKDLLVNLIDGAAIGTVFLYRYADVFFCGCTPELLVRKSGNNIESMCLAGTCAASGNAAEDKKLASELMADAKNRAEHDCVVRFIRSELLRTCYDVCVPQTPQIMRLVNIQHLMTPARAKLLDGVGLSDVAAALHPTPAVSGLPVGQAKMLIRRIETFNRGFFAGTCGVCDGAGNGEFSVALRSGVFDGHEGWLYAGCGIVAESDVQLEFDEINMKLRTILMAFGS